MSKNLVISINQSFIVTAVAIAKNYFITTSFFYIFSIKEASTVHTTEGRQKQREASEMANENSKKLRLPAKTVKKTSNKNSKLKNKLSS